MISLDLLSGFNIIRNRTQNKTPFYSLKAMTVLFYTTRSISNYIKPTNKVIIKMIFKLAKF